MASGSSRSIEMDGFDRGKSAEIPRYALERRNTMISDNDDMLW